MKTRTYTEAAAVLGVPVSKVSRAIRSIEATSRLRLVRRTEKSVHLTEAGLAYLASCRETRFRLKPFPPIRQGLFASPAYLARREPIEDLDSLKTHQCIGYSTTADLNVWEGQQLGNRVRIIPSFDFIISDAEMQLAMAKSDLGVALLPLWLAHADLTFGKLVRVLPEFEGDPILFNILHSGRSRTTAKERAFLDFLDSIVATQYDPRVQGQTPSEFFVLTSRN